VARGRRLRRLAAAGAPAPAASTRPACTSATTSRGPRGCTRSRPATPARCGWSTSRATPAAAHPSHPSGPAAATWPPTTAPGVRQHPTHGRYARCTQAPTRRPCDSTGRRLEARETRQEGGTTGGVAECAAVGAKKPRQPWPWLALDW